MLSKRGRALSGRDGQGPSRRHHRFGISLPARVLSSETRCGAAVRVSRHRRARRFGLLILSLLALAFGPIRIEPSPSPLRAHGETVESEPPPGAILQRAPEEVRVTMSAPLDEGSFVQVLAPDFSRVDQGGTRIDADAPSTMRVRVAPLAPGGYTVQWTAVDAIDGHRTHGSFAFDLVEAGPLARLGSPRGLATLLLLSLATLLLLRRSGLGARTEDQADRSKPAPRRARSLASLGLAALAALTLGCTSDGAGGASDQGAGADPDAGGETAPGLQVSIAASDLAVGEERFAFVLLDAAGALVPDAALRVTFFHLEGDDSAAEPVSRAEAAYYPARIEGAGLYVIHTRFARAGLWGAQIEGALEGGETMRPQRIRFTVAQRSAAPQVGEIPPPTHNRTLSNPERGRPGTDSDSDSNPDPDPDPDPDTDSTLDPEATRHILAAISSDPNPEPEFYRWTVDEARLSGRPTVVVFATPGFCQTAICGPVLEETKALFDTWGAAVDFIHIEVYEDAASQELVPEMEDWGLSTEPWVFVLGKDGRVAARLEGSATEAEVSPILRSLVTGP